MYDTGRDLLDAGVIEGEDTLPGTAKVKLMWALANAESAESGESVESGESAGSIEAAMGESLAGEIRAQSRPWT